MASPPSSLTFLAAVERPVSVVFRAAGGTWEGHDYRVEVIAERIGLDGYDVVVDFRDLEAALDAWLAPLNGRTLEEAGIAGPIEMVQKLLDDLAAKVPAPARLAQVSLIDGRGRCISVKSA
jgi:hypothetical protein